MLCAYTFKGVLIGDCQVGKSNLLLRYTENEFKEMYDMTIGFEFGSKIVNINEIPIRLHLLGISDQHPFRPIARIHCVDAAAAIFLYDVTKRESFDDISDWVSEIVDNAPRTVIRALVGNKVDKEGERAVLYEEGQKFANDHQMIYLETSAKTGWNVGSVFNFVATEILMKIRNGQIDADEKFGIKISKKNSEYHSY